MNYKVIELSDVKYIHYNEGILGIKDIMDIISSTMETNISKVLIDGKKIADDFYNLRTGFAGEALQKFINYNVKVGIILENQEDLNVRFREMIGEANKGNDFRMFKNILEAEKWFLSL